MPDNQFPSTSALPLETVPRRFGCRRWFCSQAWARTRREPSRHVLRAHTGSAVE